MCVKWQFYLQPRENIGKTFAENGITSIYGKIFHLCNYNIGLKDKIWYSLMNPHSFQIIGKLWTNILKFYNFLTKLYIPHQHILSTTILFYPYLHFV